MSASVMVPGVDEQLHVEWRIESVRSLGLVFATRTPNQALIKPQPVGARTWRRAGR